MTIDKIKKKITKSADARITEITERADAEIKEITTKEAQRRTAYEHHYRERTEALVQLHRQKTLAQARLEAKKAALQERERIIDEFLTEAFQNPGAQYAKYLEQAYKEGAKLLDGKLSIECSKGDFATVKKFASGTIKEAPISGGLILTDTSGKKLDESFDALLDRKRNDVRQEIAHIIGA